MVAWGHYIGIYISIFGMGFIFFFYGPDGGFICCCIITFDQLYPIIFRFLGWVKLLYYLAKEGRMRVVSGRSSDEAERESTGALNLGSNQV